jgi:hypothetical protein
MCVCVCVWLNLCACVSTCMCRAVCSATILSSAEPNLIPTTGGQTRVRFEGDGLVDQGGLVRFRFSCPVALYGSDVATDNGPRYEWQADGEFQDGGVTCVIPAMADATDVVALVNEYPWLSGSATALAPPDEDTGLLSCLPLEGALVNGRAVVSVSCSFDGGTIWTTPNPLLALYQEPCVPCFFVPGTVPCSNPIADSSEPERLPVTLRFPIASITPVRYPSARVHIQYPSGQEIDQAVELVWKCDRSEGTPGSIASFVQCNMVLPGCTVAGTASVAIALNGVDYVPLNAQLSFVTVTTVSVVPPCTYPNGLPTEVPLVVRTRGLDASVVKNQANAVQYVFGGVAWGGVLNL